MLSFTTPRVESSLVVKSAATIRPRDRLAVGRTASLIVPRLYLANLFTAQDAEQLSKLGITHVVSVLETPPILPSSMPHLKTLHISVTDNINTNILQYLDTTTEFIRDALAESEKNKVLVHCLVGMSRSATVVCAYLIATMSMTPDKAIGLVASQRIVASPNIGFRKQLEQYYARIFPKPPRSPSRMTRVSAGLAGRLRVWKNATVTQSRAVALEVVGARAEPQRDHAEDQRTLDRDENEPH
ncbi:phosphotyrosine protein [Wolfiporia cocos MD-104 SS10]|uniref:Phosphotyrosine protein n=1 Tax=Wolfiporia cocos (strain MD-104) TaxID=742152 RepID=A0A2H3J986_WOLCO|nr:phosphotyrosine protein [Wolfiporia cocos MD-104 SS10]